MTVWPAEFATAAIDPEYIAIPEGELKPVPPLSEHPTNVDPETVHELTLLPSKFVTKAVDPKMAIPQGSLKPVPPVLEHPTNVDPETVHELTLLLPKFVTKAVDPEIAIPVG